MSGRILGGVLQRRATAYGSGTLSGTTTTLGSPDVAVSRKVTVWVEWSARGGARQPVPLQCIAALWSDSSGAWSVPYLDATRTYTVIAYDYTGACDPALKAGQVPT